MVKIMDIDCCEVLKVALCPILALAILEVIWNATETIGGVSILLWGVKLGILAYAGFIWVNGSPLLSILGRNE
jgi:hypothetical protein